VLRIFISHQSANNREAVALKQWLAEQRPELADEIFLDIDPKTGLKLGGEWADQLILLLNSVCEWVICLVSREWVSSHECRWEYQIATRSAKKIMVARLDDLTDKDWHKAGVPKGDITSRWQRCDLFADGEQTVIEVPARAPAVPDGPPVEFNTAALYQIRRVIESGGIHPGTFRWPPSDDPMRAPYRGWRPLEDIDAGVFFGRDAAIASGLAKLRSMRLPPPEPVAAPESMFVVLGPSGSGKSSFLRAGLVPRLQRDDRNFMVLGVMRAGHALTGDNGFAAAIDRAYQALRLTGTPIEEIEHACLRGDADRVYDMLMHLRGAAATRWAETPGPGATATEQRDDDTDYSPTLVLPLDQAEELFPAGADTPAERFLRLLAELTDRINGPDMGLIVAATIRTDRYDKMQTDLAARGIGALLFNELKPMPASEFKEVITGPAERATESVSPLTVEDKLVQKLIAAAGADTLPLLALTLDRLYQRYARTRRLTLEQYELMGGMREVVNNEIKEILPADPQQRENAIELLRSAFIGSLVNIAENNRPLRRRATESDLPADARPLIDALVEKRLLVRDRDEHSDKVVVEVALEALFEVWTELAGWIENERENVKTAEEIGRSATAWASHDHNDSWLTFEGERLAAAGKLLTQRGFSVRLEPTRAFIEACQEREDTRRTMEQQRREAQAAADRAHAVIREATALRLTSEAQAMMSGAQPGGDVRAFQQLLAAHALSSAGIDAALQNAVRSRPGLVKVIEVGSKVFATAFTRDGNALVTGDEDGRVRIWDTVTGLPIGEPLTGHGDTVYCVATSTDGQRIASCGYDGAIRRWDIQACKQIGPPITGHRGRVFSVALSPDGRLIASGGSDSTIRLWDATTAEAVTPPLTGHTHAVRSVAFSPDGRYLASGGADCTVRLWDVEAAQQLSEPLTEHSDVVYRTVFSPDGQRIVSASGDATLRQWDAATGLAVGEPMMGGPGGLFNVAYSSDGHQIFGGGADFTARIWDADSGQPGGEPMRGHGGWVLSVACSPVDERMASGGADGTLRIWAPRGEHSTDGAPDPFPWVDALRAKLTTNMTYQQWCDWVSREIDYVATCPTLTLPADFPGHDSSAG
jgi:hypothetical protein